MYKFFKLINNVKNYFIKILVVISDCFSAPFKKNAKKTRCKKISKEKILKLIRYCDDYHTDWSKGKLFVVEPNFYFEFNRCIYFVDFISVFPICVRKKVEKTYYCDKECFEKLVLKFYENRFLTDEEVKEYLTDDTGHISYWFGVLKGKKIIKF